MAELDAEALRLGRFRRHPSGTWSARFVLDPIHVTGGLLPLEAGARGNHPAYDVGIDVGGDDRLLHWFVTDAPDRPRATYVLFADGLDVHDVRSLLAVSATHSGVGRRFFLRRVFPDRVERFRATDDGRSLQRHVRVSTEWVTTPIDDVDEALAAVGFHGDAAALLERAGLLDRGSASPWSGAPEAF